MIQIPAETVIWISKTFDNNFGITRLKENVLKLNCWLSPYCCFSIKYFPIYVFDCKISSILSGISRGDERIRRLPSLVHVSLHIEDVVMVCLLLVMASSRSML